MRLQYLEYKVLFFKTSQVLVGDSHIESLLTEL